MISEVDGRINYSFSVMSFQEPYMNLEVFILIAA
jgi:hypothetical protein